MQEEKVCEQCFSDMPWRQLCSSSVQKSVLGLCLGGRSALPYPLYCAVPTAQINILWKITADGEIHSQFTKVVFTSLIQLQLLMEL